LGSKQPIKKPKPHRKLGKVDALLNEKLEKVEWGEFKIEELFEIQNTLSFNKDRLTAGNEYDYITRTSQNQGILQETGFVNEENINPSGTWSLGLLQMDFFYRERPWYAGQFIRKIVPKFELNKSSILFFTVIFNKQKQNLLSGLVRDVDKAFLNANIHLPTKNGTIDFEFMENFIAELEAERIAELEAYLLATGLKDYTLTKEEEKALKDFENIRWNIFNLESLFGNSTRGRRLKSQNRVYGNLPFVTAGENNEGISAYIGNDVKIFSENTITIDMFGSAKYRSYKYGGDDHIAVIHTEKIPKLATLFLTAAIHKVSHAGQFDYSRNFYAKDADELNISLPVAVPPSVVRGLDYALMETFISAIQKLVIKEVVLYADRKIAATKSVVNN